MGFEIGFTEYWAAGALTESGGGVGAKYGCRFFKSVAFFVFELR